MMIEIMIAQKEYTVFTFNFENAQVRSFVSSGNAGDGGEQEGWKEVRACMSAEG